MAGSVTLDVESLRAKAAQFRADAEAMLRTADDIESHIEFLLKFADGSAPPFATAQLTPVRMPRAYASGTDNPASASMNMVGGVGKSSRYGIVTSKWLAVLRLLAETAQDEPFDLTTASDAVKEAQGKERRLAEIRRQFDPYIEAGYLKKVGTDTFQFTDRGFKKAGVARQLDLTEQADAFHENGAASAVADDRDEGDTSPLAPDFQPRTDD